MADDAGALLVRTGLISDQALVSARASISAHGGTIGEQLVLGGAVSDDALTEFFRSRLLVPKVNPNTLARLPPPVVEAIPADMAIEFRCVPVALDREGNLTIAMSDPSDRHAVDEIGFFTGKYVVRAVATQMQIAWCLAHYYGHITELGQRLLKPSGEPVPAPAAPPAAPTAPLPRTRGFTGRVDAARHKVLPPVAAPEINVPRPSDRLLTPTTEDLQRIAAAREGAVAAARAAVEAEATTQNTGPVAKVELPPVATAPAALAAAAAVSDGAPTAEAPPAISEPYAAVQVHVSLMAGDEQTPPRGVPQRPQRPQRKVMPDPPELAARSGEMEAHGPARDAHLDALPAVLVAIEPDEPEAPPPPPEPPTPPAPPARAQAMIIDDDDDAPEVDGDVLQAIDDREDSDDDQPDDRHGAPDDDAAVIHDVASPRDEAAPLGDHSGTESTPILLIAKPRPARETLDDDDDDEPVVLLDKRRTETPATSAAAVATAGSIADAVDEAVRAAAQRRRPERRTQIGVGLPEVAPRPNRPATDEETAAASAAMKAAAAALASAPPPDAVPVHVAPAVTMPGTTVAAAAAALLSSAATAVRRRVEAPSGAVTAPVKRAASQPSIRTPADGIPAVIDDGVSDASTRPHYSPPSMDEVDEGWGPPGTTIPPPFLGAMPGTETGPLLDTGSIPLSSDDDQPALLVAVPAPPTAAPTLSRPIVLDSAGIVRELEHASTRLVELLRALDRASTRDEAVDILIAFLVDSHHRAAFLAIKGGHLTPFVQRPPSPHTPPQLALDSPSTFQDVVGTRLPYRGTLADAAAREFTRAAFGVDPDEALILPIAVKDRVVAVLYGDGRKRHTFDEHFAIAGRAAGLALERILQTRRSTSS